MIQQNNNEFDIARSTFLEKTICCKSELKIAPPVKQRRDCNDAKRV